MVISLGLQQLFQCLEMPLLSQVDGPGVNFSRVRAPGELMSVVVTNLMAFTRYTVTITAFTASLEDGKAVGPTVFQTKEEGTFRSCPSHSISAHELTT